MAGNPKLATATEEWSPVEGFESRLGLSERATALIRAAGTGDVRLVRLLVEAGAPVADLCPCDNHESALVTAVNVGAADVVDYLLDAGASPEAARSMGNRTAADWSKRTLPLEPGEIRSTWRLLRTVSRWWPTRRWPSR